MRLRYVLAVLVLLGAAAAAGGAVFFRSALTDTGPLGETRTVYIAPGSSVRGIAGTLEKEGMIAKTWAFELGARLLREKSGLRAGEYEVPAHSSMRDIILLLQSGKTYQRKLTIPEGLTSFEIVALVNAADAMTGMVADIPPDGSLLPETYNYSYGDDRARLVARMQTEMEKTLESLWNGRAEGLPVATPEEAAILASVVEKETGIAAERAQVAGVFVNRLRLGMPLQSDPTVIYALTGGKGKLDRPLLRKDLEIESPYNTYRVRGLPPAPIANPGRESLQAVLHPETHDYLYFVASGDGGHNFGRTLDEHLRNVSDWKKQKSGER